MSKPFKGIFQDCNLVDQPEGFYRDSQNVIYNKLKDSICNEGGFEEITNLPSGAVFNGSVRLEMSTVVIYTLNGSVYFKELRNGLLSNDLVVIVNTILNLDPNYPVRGIFFNNNKGERLIVIIDGLNSPKLINLDIQQQINLSNAYLLELFPKGDVPILDNITVNNSGGSLSTGTYAFAVNYVFDDDSETNYFNISNFVPIFRASSSTSNNKFVGNDSEVVTSKSITLNLTNLDISYKKLNVAIIKYSEGNIFVNKVTYNYSSTSKTVVITGNESSEALLFEEIITKRISYDSANALTYSNKKLYLAGLNKQSFPDFRPYANAINTTWVFDETVNLDTVQGSHKDSNTIILKTSGMPDEVYAYEIAFNLKDGTQSPAFHIPGRAATTFTLHGNTYDENVKIQDIRTSDTSSDIAYLDHDLMINPNIRYFHTRDTSTSAGTMSYWQNENETYDTDYPDLGGQNVRHHKFPSLSKLIEYEGNWINYGSVDPNIKVYTSDISDTIELVDDFYDLYLTIVADTGNSGDTFDITVKHVKNGSEDILCQYGIYDQDTLSEVVTILNRKCSAGNDNIYVDISSVNANFTVNLSLYHKIDNIGKLKGKILGVRFDNIVIPQEIKDIADSYEIFYTKRTETNSTVIGQSLLFQELETLNVVGNIDTGDEFSIHPPDLLKNQEYPRINPDYIKYQATIKDIDDKDYKYLSKDQVYDNTNISNTREILPIENVKYEPYLTENKKETRVVGSTKIQSIAVDSGVTYGYLSNLCNYLADVYTDNTFLVSMGKTFNVTTSDTSDLYKLDMYLNEYSLRCTPEYENRFDDEDFGKRLAYGTYSFACFNRSNVGLRLEGDNFGETFYPLKDIVVNPVLGEHFSDVWGDAPVENETPDHYDNYLIINNDLYKRNDINAVQPKEDTDEIEYFPNLIIQSESVQYGSKGGNIRTFLPINYYEMPKNKGKIINLESKGKDVIIHLEDSIYRTVSEVRLDPTQVNVTLGSGKIFDIDPDEIFPTTGGYAGTQHWTSCFMTKAGYFFVDNRRKKIFLMSDKLEEISNYGMKTFFEENLDFEINKQLVSNNLTPLTANNPNHQYGIGYVVGFDDKYNRILFTKRDFKVNSSHVGSLRYENNIAKIYNHSLYPEFSNWVQNKSFTISYSLETKSWTSFHTYHPQWWLYNYTTPFTLFKGNNLNSTIYSFNKDLKNGLYYTDVPQQSYIEFVFNEQSNLNKLLENVEWEDSFIADDGIIDNGQTFNKIQIKNSYQDTGIIDLKIETNYRGINPITGIRDNSANLAKKLGVWNFNRIITPLKQGETYKQQNKFIDKYNTIRLINTNEVPNVLYLSNIDVRQRFSQF